MPFARRAVVLKQQEFCRRIVDNDRSRRKNDDESLPVVVVSSCVFNQNGISLSRGFFQQTGWQNFSFGRATGHVTVPVGSPRYGTSMRELAGRNNRKDFPLATSRPCCAVRPTTERRPTFDSEGPRNERKKGGSILTITIRSVTLFFTQLSPATHKIGSRQPKVVKFLDSQLL